MKEGARVCDLCADGRHEDCVDRWDDDGYPICGCICTAQVVQHKDAGDG